MRTALLGCLICALPSSLLLADDPCPIQWFTGEPGYSNSFGGQMKIEAGRLIIRDGSATTACPGGGDPFGCSGGALYSYRLNGERLTDPQFIYPPDVGFNDKFGWFDVEGDRMVAGTARRSQDPRLGGLHVYEIDPDTDQWIEVQRIPAPSIDPSPTHGFGADIELAGDFVLTSWHGLLFLFQRGTESWDLVQTIGEIDPANPRMDGFGSSLAMNDGWVVVNAHSDDTLGYPHGVLYVYRRDAAGLLTLHDTHLPPIAGGLFAPWMTLEGSTLMISGSGSDPAGSIFVYQLTDNGLEFRQDLTIDGLFDQFVGIGMGISIAGDTMVCGSWRGTWRRNEKAGYVFNRGGDGVWRYVALLDPRPAASWTVDDLVGHYTATDGRIAVLGSPNEQPDPSSGVWTGGAYAFDLGCEICQPDLDLDGTLTVFDFLTFLNLFQDADPLADFDGDGELTIFDFLAFQTAFDAGCA